MDPSSTHHHQQEMSSQTLESMLVCTNPQQEKKARPAEQGMKCPRCDSINTKFCYYNNYSLTQPRYFCKSCRRYWTKGGTLRNVPVGGGCRKNKRSSSKRTQENPTLTNNDSNPFLSSLTPTLSYDNYSSDLSVAFARLQQKQHNGQMLFDDYEFSMMGNNNNNLSVNPSPLSSGNGLFDSLRSGFFETPNGFGNNFYNGNMSNNHGQIGHFENGGLGINNATGGLAYENARSASVKQEGDQNSNRILWGFPWQINGGDANMAATDLDSVGKQSWNGFSSSTWQGLINSPLI
ncbi:hypothetical protein Leryth_016492 [Lithospermum erythrorhizon]|uniref:Dof zinc finger protein n=1 Tax=Lithospermum erythrorhizon TaxID=34254 RepID=A0AAV3R0V7_LITER|nr:hypothetical protein Leryth_016492 [Lithospermum erythrorhizon]